MQEGTSNVLMIVLGVIVFAILAAILYATFQPTVDSFFASLQQKMTDAWSVSGTGGGAGGGN